MPNSLWLRKVRQSDLVFFFEHQLDPEANDMAAFTARDPSDKAAFSNHWAKVLADEAITLRTIVAGDCVAGHIVCHRWFGEPEISYWLGRDFWGRGVATWALSEFLKIVKERPLYARVAKDNLASARVLEKCGFQHFDEDKGYANARGREIEEFIFHLP